MKFKSAYLFVCRLLHRVQSPTFQSQFHQQVHLMQNQLSANLVKPSASLLNHVTVLHALFQPVSYEKIKQKR